MCSTFSKIYGLAGLRVGYMVAPEEVVLNANKVKRAFDVSSAAQSAALASLDDTAELERRRAVNAESIQGLAALLREQGFEPAAAVANFLYVDTGEDVRPLFEALLAKGAIVRPLHGFGAPTAFRVTNGTPDDNLFFAEALAGVSAR